MSSIKWILIPALAMAPSVFVVDGAQAIAYLNEQEAQQTIFGNIKLTKNFITLTDDQAKQIKDISSMDVRSKEVKMWQAANGATFIIDEVLGKHEFITYAIGINKDGTIKQIEIMNYNETYGYEIRNKDWRDQFVGKNVASDFKFDGDIKNISGATLSCKHVTQGVKRVLATYDLIVKK